MFDHIHFHKFNLSEWLINEDSSNYWYSFSDYQKPDDITMYTSAINADYDNITTVSLLPFRPLSNYAKEHYLYLQCFGMLWSDENYYTRRENYDSYLMLYTYSGAGYLEYEGKEYYLKEGMVSSSIAANRIFTDLTVNYGIMVTYILTALWLTICFCFLKSAVPFYFLLLLLDPISIIWKNYWASMIQLLPIWSFRYRMNFISF